MIYLSLGSYHKKNFILYYAEHQNESSLCTSFKP